MSSIHNVNFLLFCETLILKGILPFTIKWPCLYKWTECNFSREIHALERIMFCLSSHSVVSFPPKMFANKMYSFQEKTLISMITMNV